MMFSAWRRLATFAVVLCLTVSMAYGEGLFPSFEKIFVELPSFQMVAKRTPDDEFLLEDGSRSIVFKNVTEDEFNAFSKYIAEYGCTLDHYVMEDMIFSAEVVYETVKFKFIYSFVTKEANLIYPAGSLEEKVELATPTPQPTATPKPTPTSTPKRTSTPKPTATPKPTGSSYTGGIEMINVQELFNSLKNSNVLLSTNKPSSSVSLEILNHDEVICKRVSTKKYAFQFRVKNNNSSKTVRSYDVSYYTCDEYGNQNSPTETVTLTQKIKAYETIMSDIVYLMNPDEVYRAYFAITRVRYTDGTSESTSSPEYCYWYWDK